MLPRNFRWGALLLVAAGTAFQFTNLNYALSISMALQICVFMPLALQGLCYQQFMYLLRKRSTAYRVVVRVLLVLCLPYSLFFLAFFGLFDLLMQVRTKIIAQLKDSGDHHQDV